MLSEGRVFKERSEKKKKGAACREGMVSQVADMKVYLEGSEKHHETGRLLHQKKNTVNLFMHTVSPRHSCLILYYILQNSAPVLTNVCAFCG